MDYYNRGEISNSDLSWIEKQAYGAKFETDNLEAIFAFGSYFHQLVLEPHLPWNNKLKIDKKKAQKMCDSILNFEFAGHRISNIIKRESFIAEKEFYTNIEGVACRGKADGYDEDINLVFELKSTAATSQNSFIAAIEGMNIDRQNAFYLDLSKSDICLTVGVSKKNHKVFPYVVIRDDETYKRGKRKYKDLLMHYKMIYEPLI